MSSDRAALLLLRNTKFGHSGRLARSLITEIHRYLTQSPRSHGLSPRIKLHRHTTPSYRLQRAAIPMMHPSERPVAALLLRRPILVLGRQRARTSSFCLRLERIPLLPTASARKIAQYALAAPCPS